MRDLIDSFTRLRVVVIGEAMVDTYMSGPSNRLCQEAPVPVVEVVERSDLPGGAANTACNVRRLGGEVDLVSVIGADPDADVLREALGQCDVDGDGLLVAPSRRTITKQRLVSGDQVLLRFDQGSVGPIDRFTEAALLDRIRQALPGADAVIVSDYDAGLLTPRVVEQLVRMRRRGPELWVVDSKRAGALADLRATAMTPNYREAMRLVDAPELRGEERVGQVESLKAEILARTGAEVVAVTLDREGAVVLERGGPTHRTYARPSLDRRASGAGDTFTAALALAMAAGATTPEAGELASLAAEVVVQKERTATCSAEELVSRLEPGKVHPGRESLLTALESARSEGRTIVFTNGCFDILHRGHIRYLTQAKALGDVLVVAVNADESVRRLKGEERPINPLEDRLEVLAGLSCVDHLVAFGEDTPLDLIAEVRPDVFCKGGDYSRESIPEAPAVEAMGGRVVLLPYVDDRSTTGLIERIRREGGDGPDDASLVS